MARDPIPAYRTRLLAAGIDEAALADIERDIAARVDEATEAAKASPAPGAEFLMSDVWADGGSSWRN